MNCTSCLVPLLPGQSDCRAAWLVQTQLKGSVIAQPKGNVERLLLSLPTHLSDGDNFCARRTNSLRRESRCCCCYRARPMLSRQSETQGPKRGRAKLKPHKLSEVWVKSTLAVLRCALKWGREKRQLERPVRASGLEGNAGDRPARAARRG